jgi:gas vesicle protein
MRGFLFGMCLGAIAGVLYAPATGMRTRALIRDKYTSLNTDATEMIEDAKSLIREQSGPLKEKALGMREDMNNKITEVRGMVEQKVGELKEQVNGMKQGESEGGGEMRQSA